PRLTDANAPARYQTFFTQFDAALAQLDQNIANGMYGCPSSPQCAAVRDSSAFWHGVRNALDRSVDSLGATFQPFLPRDSSDAGAHYAGAAAALVRLPTGATDSADDVLRQWIGDHQTDLEGRLVQELTVGPVWLNVAVRAGLQRAGTRVRRVAPWYALLVPSAATTALRWDPGDYLGVDVAPLVRLAPQLAAGLTAGYWTKARDR